MAAVEYIHHVYKVKRHGYCVAKHQNYNSESDFEFGVTFGTGHGGVGVPNKVTSECIWWRDNRKSDSFPFSLAKLWHVSETVS